MSTVESIAAKYGHEMQNDAKTSAIGSLQKKAQGAIDNLFAAYKKAGSAIDAYNNALPKAAANFEISYADVLKKRVNFNDVLNNLKSGTKMVV